MKKVRKLAGLLLALVMVMGLSVTTFADTGTSTITIKEVPTASHTITAYQIFDGDVTGNTLSNVVWGDGVNDSAALTAAQGVTTDDGSTYPFVNCTTAAEVAKVLAENNTNDDLVKAFAAAMNTTGVLASSSGTASNASDGNGTYTYTISGIDTGYYLVTDATSATEADAASTYILEVVGTTASATYKNKVPVPTKTITNSTGDSDLGTSVSVGDTVSFELTGDIPSYAADYTEGYTYIFWDTLSNGLTYAGNLVVKAGTTTTLEKDVNYTVAPNGQSLKVTILNAENYAGQTITVTYDATLNDNAVAGTAEYNTLYLEYSNDPDGDGTGKSIEKQTYVYTFDLTVDKVDESGIGLEGAAFTLYKEAADITEFESGVTYYTYANNEMTEVDSSATFDGEETYYTQVGSETDAVANGSEYTATFEELGAGDYVLIETKTPAGYNTITPVEFTISVTYKDDGQIDEMSCTGDGVSVAVENTSLNTEIENKSGTSMPTTGGMGTTLFYIIGSLLVFGAAVILITRRRMRAE